eukprot:NODE_324_length_2408_cov_71.628233_g302_i0.p1 GENE.NODE_324_length_2408_cov_71.628233_g302_i0~~NODE_324_length_2408_cov_71.628233_g302_i0.p1  ORF type:complete len:759 (-),score=238.72 NODE_324_length_2408_cov_71.628233_g302_i0:73-2349(-)
MQRRVALHCFSQALRHAQSTPMLPTTPLTTLQCPVRCYSAEPEVTQAAQAKQEVKEDAQVKPEVTEAKTETEHGASSNPEAFPEENAEDDMVDGPEDAAETAKEQLIEETETTKGPSESFGFQTETRQLLDIVARSLYTETEIFVRELISNASDALEKRRHVALTDASSSMEDGKIMLSVDDAKRTFSIQDTGIGMNKEELLNHLGTIARSGSKAFLQKLQDGGSDAADSIIGQFGVGFYSSFMVAKAVRVYTKSAKNDSVGYLWESDGSGEFKITEAEGVQVGTKIVIDLKESDSEFSNVSNVERIVKKYSNFIGFPITLNGKRVNTVEALWRKNPKDVSAEEHDEFYKFVSKAFEAPLFQLHYKVDAPIDLKALFYIGHSNTERYGMSRLESNINLYCRKVLIKPKAKEVLPEWMRFVVGVVDSEDLPLNISRESIQDSAQIRRLNTVCTKRILKWLDTEAKADPTKYDKFFNEFGNFLKEGACTDPVNKADIAKLLRFESSRGGKGDLVSLDEYLERMATGQEKIYYLQSPSRETALASPYYEQFKSKKVEVLFLHGPIDEYLVSHLDQYKEYKLFPVESPDTELDKVQAADEPSAEAQQQGPALPAKQCEDLSQFLMKALSDRLMEAKPSSRLTSSPAVIVTGHQQAAMHRMMKQMSLMQGKTDLGKALGKQRLEFNPNHAVVKKLATLAQHDEPRATQLAEQLFDNALIAAGLLEDPQQMLARLNHLLEMAMRDVEAAEEPAPVAEEAPRQAE